MVEDAQTNGSQKNSREQTKMSTYCGRQKPDEYYMRLAIRQAKKAEALGEVPIGCVVVRDGLVIGRGYNRRNTDKSVFGHAEISAMKKAGKKVGDWRLEDCTMYVTLEPCQMCAGAAVQARIPRVVLGAKNPKAGCAGSVLNLFQVERFNHQIELTEGVLEPECAEMLSAFFKRLRVKKKEAAAAAENTRLSAQIGNGNGETAVPSGKNP